MKAIFENLRKFIVIARANLRLKYAIRLAEREHRRHGDRFYVMPDHRDRLIVMRRPGH